MLAAHCDQGIGGRLLEAVLSYADEHDFARVVLNPSERAIPLYLWVGLRPASALLVRTLERDS